MISRKIMKPATLQINQCLLNVLNIIIPLLLYGIILVIQIPYSEVKVPHRPDIYQIKSVSSSSVR